MKEKVKANEQMCHKGKYNKLLWEWKKCRKNMVENVTEWKMLESVGRI